MRLQFTFGGGVNKITDPRRLRPDQAVAAENCDTISGALRPVSAPSGAGVWPLTFPPQSIYRYQDETDWRVSLSPRTYARFVEAKCWSDDTGVNSVQVETDGVARPAGADPTSADIYSQFNVSISNDYVIAPLAYNVDGLQEFSATVNNMNAMFGRCYVVIHEYEIGIRGIAAFGQTGLKSLTIGTILRLKGDGSEGSSGGVLVRVSDVLSIQATPISGPADQVEWSATICVCYVGGSVGRGMTADGSWLSLIENDRVRFFQDPAEFGTFWIMTAVVKTAICGLAIAADEEKNLIIAQGDGNKANINRGHTVVVAVDGSDYNRVYGGDSADDGRYMPWGSRELSETQNTLLAPIGSGEYNFAITFVDEDGVESAPSYPGRTDRKSLILNPESAIVVQVEYTSTLTPGSGYLNDNPSSRVFINGVAVDIYKTKQQSFPRINGLNTISIPDWAKKVNIYRTVAGQKDLFLLRTYDTIDGLPETMLDTTPDWVLAGSSPCETISLFPPVYFDTAADTYERVGGSYLTLHQGRYYLAYKNRLYWSEDTIHYWRLDSYFQFSSDVKGVQSAGSSLVVVTKTEVHAILGQGPENYSIRRVGTFGMNTPRLLSTWNTMPVWANDYGLCAFGGSEARMFTPDVLRPTDFAFSTAWCSYVLNDTYHLVGYGDPAGTTEILRYDLRRQQLLPSLVLSGRILAVHVDDAAGVAWAALAKSYRAGGVTRTGFSLISLAGGEDLLPYAYWTCRHDGETSALKRFNLIYPYYDEGDGIVPLTVAVYVDGRLRQTVAVNRDRHFLQDGLVGYDIQLLVQGTASVQAIEVEFEVVSNG